MTATVAAPAQHTTHQRLLHHVRSEDAPKADLDAIIVPHGRPATFLDQAVEAARQVDATLLLLCSKDARATDAVLAAKQAGVSARAIDTDEVAPRGVVPRFATTGLLGTNGLLRAADTSFKRNLGVLVAVLAGWQRVLFLDDDIALPHPEDLRAAAGLLGEHAAVGLGNSGMPDNSVVCHAYRDSGGRQDTFVGGGALMVGRSSFGSFFPDIYNEDWFFLLGEDRLRCTAVTGTAHQSPYNPYDPARAASEELGDTLAEGVYGLLDHGLGTADATESYWAEFLESRRAFIRVAVRQVEQAPQLDRTVRSQMIEALTAALDRNVELITPALCVRYLRAWQSDRLTWQDHLRTLRARHPGGGVDGALRTLRITTELVHRA
ncbi:hypothetical protein GCM10022222_14360 [Amycolatopsis ultiminotia]|uniref:Glycosyltransferase like family 2 n=1 Tax=Amycolatopsis ultiminotia TaxID=543629 RepID=A0ABP6VG15_9PSEU